MSNIEKMMGYLVYAIVIVGLCAGLYYLSGSLRKNTSSVDCYSDPSQSLCQEGPNEWDGGSYR